MKQMVDEFSLDYLKPGQKAVISKINSEEVELELLKMGISIGTSCQLSGGAPLKDPIAFIANQVKVFVRKKDATQIWMSRIS
ncbi:MAG: FeoA domain-containing protein [Bacteroidota bacterium]